MKHLVMVAALAAASLCTACTSDSGETPAAPAVTLIAAPSSVSAGQPVTLSWSSTDASDCAAAGSWTGATPPSGEQTIVLHAPGTHAFVLTCYGSGGSDSAVAEVAVGAQQGEGVIGVSLSANPVSVAVGETTSLSWSAQDASSCTASEGWSGTKPPTGSESVVVGTVGYNSFTLTCTGPAGSGTQQVHVQGLQAELALSANPPTVGAGQTTTLTWATSFASSCTASGSWSGTKAANGSEVVTVPAAGVNVFSLTCSDPGAPVSYDLPVTGVAPTVRLGAFPDQPTVGETVTLGWEGTYATGCTATGDWSGAQPAKGHVTVDVEAVGTRSYSITCSNAGGSESKTVEVTSIAAPALPPATGYMQNAGHDGFVSFAGGITLPSSATPAWSRDLGADVGYAVIADGMVFVVAGNTDDSYGNRLYALRQSDGSTAWGPVGLPGVYFWNGHTYANGRVFTLNFDGLVRAFNASNGASVWTQQMPGYWHDAEPVAYGGLLFASGNYGSRAFDQATGAVKWSSPDYSEASPAVRSDGVYLMAGPCARALDPQTGEPLWTASLCGDYGADVAMRNGTVYARYHDGEIHTADARTGSPGGSLSSQRAMAINDSVVITLYSGELKATSLASGAQRWTFSGDGNLVSTPIIVNDTVFIASSMGNVYAVDAVTGVQQWHGTTAPMSAPDQWNGRLLPGPSAGEGILVVTGGSTVAAWSLR